MTLTMTTITTTMTTITITPVRVTMTITTVTVTIALTMTITTVRITTATITITITMHCLLFDLCWLLFALSHHQLVRLFQQMFVDGVYCLLLLMMNMTKLPSCFKQLFAVLFGVC